MGNKSLTMKHPKKLEKSPTFKLAFVPVLALLIKIVVALNIREVDGSITGGWLGADGESYLKGVNGLILGGYFSDEDLLSYWPAGYPILIWLLCLISTSHVILLLSVVQSIFYGFASYIFVRSLRNSKLNSYLFPISIVLAFNPTLSLSSLVVGYESMVASCLMLLVSIILMSNKEKNLKKLKRYIVSFGIISGLATFVQPRYILVSMILGILWCQQLEKKSVKAGALIGIMSLTLIAPSILIHRNLQSIDQAIVSTNLGITMNLGAGDKTSGSYRSTGPGVPCISSNPSGVVSDSELVVCVLTWYVENPVKGIRLFVNKAGFFWSPWSGPLSNGTMARNPWLKINPVIEIASNNQTGNDLIYKFVGKSLSIIWVLTNLFFLLLGYIYLRSKKDVLPNLALLTVIPIVTSMLITMVTIGDHRFRIPTMPLSLLLQVIGLFSLRTKWVEWREKRKLGS
jgi:hypothetical protein